MIWKWEAIFTNVTMTKITLAMMMLLTIYGVMAYVRAKISYKKVRGNQRHNKTWRVGRKEADQLMKSDEIYIKLGEYYENNEQ
ncbi:hypothetical protein JCM21714_2097 [Gracilibacillus boraciitolerans JCM 21714]|uniref:Uncharacterized protein n=1 Tax=Gracilibacillus boraciitolerans JCM 21714 TaxID=1298598 RepID=W4VIT7_9BACI|nr:hypothetical protein [Gracilibacillus boraciitolerans]GAE93061.1 hypothetical protein JCM21714_2097 [Gracilibacillus boraciitolerans JCM 21714]